jgi:hypothetical protein
MNLLIANGALVSDDIDIHFTSLSSETFNVLCNQPFELDISSYKYIKSIKIQTQTKINHIFLNFVPFYQEIDFDGYLIDCQKFSKVFGKMKITIERVNELFKNEIAVITIQISQ